MSQSDYIEVTLLKGTSFKEIDTLSQNLGDLCEFDPTNDTGPKYTKFVVHDKKKNRLAFYQGSAGENRYDSYSWQLLIYADNAFSFLGSGDLWTLIECIPLFHPELPSSLVSFKGEFTGAGLTAVYQ